MSTCKLNFGDTEIEIEHGSNPSEVLNSSNSPVLFGCRTGICGTCLIQVEGGQETLTPADDEEQELLDIMAEGNSKARLACQIKIQGDLKVTYLGTK